jgi:hypothetical protein
MTLHSFFQTLVRPVDPRTERWLRRISGVAMGVLAGLVATFAVSLILELRKEKAQARPFGDGISDAGGMAHAVVLYALVPAAVLLAFGAVSVWRNRAIKWWLPVLVMGALAWLVACHQEKYATSAHIQRWAPAELLGCYEILDAKHRRADSAWYNVSAVVRLTDRPMRKFDGTVRPLTWHLRPLSNPGTGHWQADPGGEYEKGTGDAPEWSLTPAGDSADFEFSDGFSGATIQFAASDADRDTLRGRATEHWDFGPRTSNSERAYAIRRPCT